MPFMAISPWSRGGYVYSEVADHASVIKFLEKKFDVRCPNLSPWRRAVVGEYSGLVTSLTVRVTLTGTRLVMAMTLRLAQKYVTFKESDM